MIPSLAPWSRELDGLTPKAVALLAVILPRAQRLLDAADGADAAQHGDPDGLDGLARRGPFERLLLSEWALADAVPEEFLRRAAMNELLFTKQATRSQAPPPRRRVLILDAGPGSLGAPRLVQLALVLAAARRAKERGQVVAFGGMGRAEDGLVEGLSEASIRAMLSWRSHHEPPLDAHTRWAAALGDAAVDGLWVCGHGDFARAAPPGWATVSVHEPFGEPDALLVELSRGGRALGGVRLPMPDAAELAETLADPFKSPKAPKPPVATPKPPPKDGVTLDPRFLHFAALGDYLILRRMDRRVTAVLLRGRTAFKNRSSHRLDVPAEGGLLAVGWFRKRLVGVVMRDDRLWVVGWTKGVVPPIVLPPEARRPALANPHLLMPKLVGGQVSHRGPERALYFIDQAQTLWRLRLSAPFGLEHHRERVTDLSESAEFGVVYTTKQKVHSRAELAEGFVNALALDGPPIQPALSDGFIPMLGGVPLAPRCHNLLHAGGQVLEQADGGGLTLRYVSASQSSARPIRHDPNEWRIGLTGDPKREMALAVLTRHLHTNVLSLVTTEGPRALLQLGGPPKAITLSPSRLELAWIDHEGQLVVYDYNKDKELHRAHPSELP
ncbi:hypothetical protein L6R46_07325 [Myxococcota bacterium]|nr:hypothetical protein [Myxococcota bacterium]